jgi:NADH:ubiquinone oxidoreductase subunit 3 (subunit A)
MLDLVLANVDPDAPSAWAPVVLLILIGAGFAIGNVVLSTIIGPSRTGPGKEETYESGMIPVGDTRQRFNVRFYIVAMIFLVFDVEIVFFYPWASIFPHAVQTRARTRRCCWSRWSSSSSSSCWLTRTRGQGRVPVGLGREIRNPKHEIRNKHECQNEASTKRKAAPAFRAFLVW